MRWITDGKKAQTRQSRIAQTL
ncbi:MAG TPA: hypothetical protein VJ757_07905 [Pseudonocardiaceae bacterium]|nr:hypothetical protein [Pseudonocardiaceae bacterium]